MSTHTGTPVPWTDLDDTRCDRTDLPRYSCADPCCRNLPHDIDPKKLEEPDDEKRLTRTAGKGTTGTCTECGLALQKGDRITYTDDGETHEVCAR